MSKKIIVRVINNRVQFKCSSCTAKRNYPVQPHVRCKNIRCHKCHAITTCTLNRRLSPRELSSGNAILITNEGKTLEVFIHDISISGGIGLDIPISAARARTVKIGTEIRFNCKWNPRMLGSGRFKVINSKGQRIGIKKVV